MDIDTLGQRYLALGEINLPDKVFFSFEQNQKVYHLKAFRATGAAMQMDDLWYYTQVEGALVLELGVRDHHLLPQLQYPELFVFTEHREDGYIADYSKKYRGGIPEECDDAFDKLFTLFEYLVKKDESGNSTVQGV